MNEGEAEVLVPRRLTPQSTGWVMVGWWLPWLGGVGWIYFRSWGGLCWRVFAQWWYGRKSWYHFSLWLSGLRGESKGGEVFESCKNPMESKIHERFCLGNKEKWLDICDAMNWLKHQDHQRDVMALRWYYDSHQWLYTSVIAIKTIISGFCLGFDQGEIAAADAEESWHPYGAPWRWGELRWWFPRSREGGTDLKDFGWSSVSSV